MKKAIKTINAPAATGPFSQGIITNDLIFTSGQIHLDKEGQLINGSIEEKAHQVLGNLKAILSEAGASFDSVLKVTIYVKDMTNYGAINSVYATYFSEPFPAREVICVKSLPLDADLEISIVASKSTA